MKRYIRQFGLALLILCLAWPMMAQEASIKEAEVAYTKEDYKTAIELYEGLLKTMASRRLSIIIWEMLITRADRLLRLS